MRELGFYYKITDIPRAMGLRFQHERPYDAFLLQDGVFKAIEYKVLKHKTIKISRDLKKHQIENLNAVVKNGGEAYIIFLVEKNNAIMINLSDIDINEEIKLDDKRLTWWTKEKGKWRVSWIKIIS